MTPPLHDIASLALSLGISIVPPRRTGQSDRGPASGNNFKPNSRPRANSRTGTASGRGLDSSAVRSARGSNYSSLTTGRLTRRFKAAADGLGQAGLIEDIETGYLEETLGGGVHWFYYTKEIRGSTKLAVRKDPAGGLRGLKTLIETKGEGGFVIVAPSHGRVHPSGNPYRLIRGGLETVVQISGEERQWLWDLARSFDQGYPTEDLLEVEEAKVSKKTPGGWNDLTSPGDDFNARTKWEDVLPDWTRAFAHGDTTYWRRPGKTFGHSATTNHNGTDRLHVFTSSSEFEPGQSYSRFAAYAKLHHKCDFRVTAKALYDLGYGQHKRWVWEDQTWILRTFQNPCPNGQKAAKPGDPHPTTKAAPDVLPVFDGSSTTESVADKLEAMTDEDLGLVGAETIDPEPIQWEWQNRVARGKLNLLAGEGGDGKSQISIAVIAAVTTGGKFPDGTGPVAPGFCFVLAAEDGARDTIIPRLIAAGAERKLIKVNTAKVTFKDKNGKAIIHPVSFQDLPYWRVVLTRYKVRVLIADPIPAYLGRGVNDNRNSDLRAILEPFVDLLDELGVALIGVTHLNKSTDHKTPTHKILGSVAYANLARTVHCTYRDPEDTERRFLCMVKANIVAPQPTLAFRIKPNEFQSGAHLIKTSKVEFEPNAVDWSPTAHLNGEKQPAAVGRPAVKVMKDAEFLYDLLCGLNWMPLVEIIEHAGTMGLLGEQKEDGKYPNVNSLYRAQERVPHLAPPKDGFRVIVEKMPFRGRGKDTPHWKLEALEDVPF